MFSGDRITQGLRPREAGEPLREFYGPGEAAYPDPADVFDLIAEEQRFARRTVEAVVGPGRRLLVRPPHRAEPAP